MSPGDDSTLSHFDESLEVVGAVPTLIVALDCEQPLRPSLRLSLAGVSQVDLGRGRERSSSRASGVLVVRLADRWMSTAHARLTHDGSSWILHDLGSKNGTLVNGERCERLELTPGDVIEVGHTILLFAVAALHRQAEPDVEAHQLRPRLPELATFSGPLAQQLEAMAHVAARSSATVMISGASGTGKEVTARALHRLSGRHGAFVAVNCGSIPSGLFEAELFGCKKGAFTGATEDRPGLIRAADGGTLFLDEIGDLPAASQMGLLRVLQEREVLPIGAVTPVPVDLRVVTATHRDLGALVEGKTFRADLLARLDGHRVILPSLAERREDLGILLGDLIRGVTAQPDKVRFTGRAARALFRYEWPCNIRELEKCLERAVALAGQAPIDLPHLPESLRAAPSHPPTPISGPEPSAPVLSDEDRRLREELVARLRSHSGNVAAVGRAMGKASMQIHRWIKRFELDLRSFR